MALAPGSRVNQFTLENQDQIASVLEAPTKSKTGSFTDIARFLDSYGGVFHFQQVYFYDLGHFLSYLVVCSLHVIVTPPSHRTTESGWPRVNCQRRC